MNSPAAVSFNDRGSAPLANSELVQREVLRVMREAGRSMTKSEIASCVRYTMLEVNIAIDRLQPDTITRVISHGVIRFKLVDEDDEAPAANVAPTSPAKAAAPAKPFDAALAYELGRSLPPSYKTDPAESSKPEQKPKCATTGIKSAVLRGLNEQTAPITSADLAKALGLGLQQVKSALKTLKIDGLAKLDGHRNNARWSLANQVVTQQASEQPAAVQAEVTHNTATEGVVPKGYSRDETSAPGPRDGSGPSLDSLASGEALLKAHEIRAEREAARRVGARESLQGAYGDLNDLITDLKPQPGAALLPTTRLITEATFALWSDGRLQVNANHAVIEFSKGATRQLINYLDQICEIDPASRV